LLFLKDLGVKQIATSRRIVDNNISTAKSLADAGIEMFAFHVNHDKGKDEKYVVCKESDLFYGLYADRWDFEASVDCDYN